MCEHRVVVVFGATGRQGGSVAKLLSEHKEFHVKAVTRHPHSKTATYLHDKGIEIVKADLSDFVSLKPVLKGAWGCFLATDFWETCDKGEELKMGENVVNLCKLYGVSHLVYSGLESTWDLMQLKCDHFEGKSNIEKYIDRVKVPHTVVRLPEFMENFLDNFLPCKEKDGRFSLNIPVGNSKIPLFPAIELGFVVLEIFRHPELYTNKTIGLVSDWLTVQACADIMTQEIKPFTFYNAKINRNEYVKGNFGNCEDLANMFEFIERGGMQRDLELTKHLYPGVSDFKTWLRKHRQKFISTLDSK